MPTPSPTTPTVTQAVIRTMDKCGGSFVRKLADLWAVCDQENRNILERAYSEVFYRYEQMSKKVAS